MLLSLLALLLAGPGRAADAPALRSATLDNGLKVSIYPDPSLPIVATQVWVQVGSAHEAPNEKGFAHLFEHLMFGKTTTYDKEAYSRHHTVYGGYENAYTMFDNTVYLSQIPPEGHGQVLVFEADRMRNLVLDADNLANEQKIVTEELRLRTQNDPTARMIGPALEAIFGKHPYGHSPAGTEEDIAAADLALVRKFYSGYYHPANMHLVVVGPVDPDAEMARIQELFGPLGGERLVPPDVPALTNWPLPDRVELREDIPPIKVAAQLYRGPSARDPDYWAFRVMMEMLSGGELDRFREELVTRRGKAVEAFAQNAELRAGTLFIAGSISLPFRREKRAFALIDQTLDTLDQGDWRSQELLDTARRRLLVEELGRRYYADQLADAVGQAYAWQGDDQLGVGGAAAAIDAVTLPQVEAAWERYIVGATPTRVFARHGAAQIEDTP